MKIEPTSYKEVMSSVDAPFWKEVINSEMESIKLDNTLGDNCFASWK